MGAASVTGTGLGSAIGNQKGSEHLSVGAEKIVGPRIVYSGSVTTDGSGDATIELPQLPGVASDYVVLVTENGVAAAAACAASVAITSVTTITVKGPVSTACSVLVAKKGLAL